MGRKKVTSSDVARRAGVSQATVWMVLNKKYNVSFGSYQSEPDKPLLCYDASVNRVSGGSRAGIWDFCLQHAEKSEAGREMSDNDHFPEPTWRHIYVQSKSLLYAAG